jgi:Fur family transcriptional regulator, ferric uptake regulator
MEKAHTILKRNELSITESRKKILELFLQQNGALKHSVIEKKIGTAMDRVTIYRTLQLFTDKGLIHTIPTSDNSISYALCQAECEEGHHHDNHVHFICNNCNNTSCLTGVTIPKVRLPKGFTPLQTEMVVTGVCQDCTT